MSCGQAASRMVIYSRTDKDVAESTLRTESHKRQGAGGYDELNGTSITDVPKMLGDHGVKHAGKWKRQATIEDMEGAVKKGPPAMVLLRDPGHFVVLDGIGHPGLLEGPDPALLTAAYAAVAKESS